MIPLMSTGGGGDQVKERTVGLWATPLTDWGGDDGAIGRDIGKILFLHHCSYLCQYFTDLFEES